MYVMAVVSSVQVAAFAGAVNRAVAVEPSFHLGFLGF